MAHTYMLFDFGADEEKAQQARHRLEGWKQAFRLDKKLQFKFDRGEASETPAVEPAESTEPPPAPAKMAKPVKSAKPKGKSKSSDNPESKSADAPPPASNGSVKLLVRLYFSCHEKLSEQRCLDRIPAEEPFKAASPKVVGEDAADFPGVLKHFEELE